jgi:hypothetical protein
VPTSLVFLSCKWKPENFEVRECLLSFGAESVVFQVAIQKLKDQDIYKYSFARGFLWV